MHTPASVMQTPASVELGYGRVSYKHLTYSSTGRTFAYKIQSYAEKDILKSANDEDPLGNQLRCNH